MGKSTVLVIFGITGDLVKKKVIKALYQLYQLGRLPEDLTIYGFSRRDFTNTQLRQYLKEVLSIENSKCAPFLGLFNYVQGTFDAVEGFHKLHQLLSESHPESEKIFYLPVPPDMVPTIVQNMDLAGLTKESNSKLVLEKPFGTDLASANSINNLLQEVFEEKQIYRIDHYLAKDIVKNIIAFRFTNSIIDTNWESGNVESIEVRLLETERVSERADFYDKVGALNDVGQSHLLQLLGLFIMDRPKSFHVDEIKALRADAIASLIPLTPSEVETDTIRSQYKGFKEEEGVSPYSQTETYFKITMFSSKKNLKDVPLVLESGKAMEENCVEVRVKFKHADPCLCTSDGHFQNELVYSIKPQPKITFRISLKDPGFEFKVVEHSIDINYTELSKTKEIYDDYAQLFFDIFREDGTLFVSIQEILAQWAVIEPIKSAWEEGLSPIKSIPS